MTWWRWLVVVAFFAIPWGSILIDWALWRFIWNKRKEWQRGG